MTVAGTSAITELWAKIKNKFATKTELSTAKSEAISTAASDATSKANAAKTAAISAAAQDATNKVNAIQVGGRNLLHWSRFDASKSYSRSGSSYQTIEDGVLTISTPSTGITSWLALLATNYAKQTVTTEDTLTVSFDYKFSRTSTGTTNPYRGFQLTVVCENGYWYYGMNPTEADTGGEWRHYQRSVELSGSSKGALTNFQMEAYWRDYVGSASYKNVKVELGNKPTDWTPAPEDVESSILTKADKTDAIKNITRSGTTFTATRADGTTFTFTQQDNNSITGVKGNAESSYRTGNVNLTPANIGALALSGGTLTGNILGNQTVALGTTASPFHNLVLGGATNTTMTKDSANPRITFCENTGTQPVHLLYTDYDGYRNPAGLKIIGGDSATPAWLEVEGTVYAAGLNTTGAITQNGTAVSLSGHTHNTLNFLGRKNTVAQIAFNPSVDTGCGKLSFHISDSTARSNDATNSPSFDCAIINLPWDWGAYNGQIAIGNNSSTARMQIRSASHTDNGESANPRYTPNYGAWREVVTAPKATQIGNSTTPVYISDTGQVAQCSTFALSSHTHNYAGSSSAGGAATTALACTGNAATATKATQDESGNNIKASYASSFSISDHTITLKNKNGGSLGTVTVPDNDTKNTAGSTDTSSKIFLIGATSQAANPQTYSDNEVYATSGILRSTKFNVADHVTQQYNTTTQALDFIFS